MIWFFLMGMIAGAVGVIMILRYWFRTHMRQITPEEFRKEFIRTDNDMEGRE